MLHVQTFTTLPIKNSEGCSYHGDLLSCQKRPNRFCDSIAHLYAKCLLGCRLTAPPHGWLNVFLLKTMKRFVYVTRRSNPKLKPVHRQQY